MREKFEVRKLILWILGLALFGVLVWLIVKITTTDWRTYDINEVQKLFSFYYGSEGFEGVEVPRDDLVHFGMMNEDPELKMIVMKNFEPMNEPKEREDGKNRYLLLEVGLDEGKVKESFESLEANITSAREYYAENEEGNEYKKALYDGAKYGKGHDFVYVLMGDEAELMEREMKMLLK